jgi:hypothetical protein
MRPGRGEQLWVLAIASRRVVCIHANVVIPGSFRVVFRLFTLGQNEEPHETLIEHVLQPAHDKQTTAHHNYSLESVLRKEPRMLGHLPQELCRSTGCDKTQGLQ